MKAKKIDSSVFESFVRGDEKAFAIVYSTYSSILFKKIQYIIRDEEESLEVLQLVFVKLWDKKESLSLDFENFESYLLKMSISMSIDLLRKNVRLQKVKDNLLMQQHSIHGYSVEDDYLLKESDEIIKEAIAVLPPQRKLIFMLCRIEGKSYAEVSEMLNVSSSTISNQLVSATKFVKKFTQKYHNEIKILFFSVFF